MPSHKFSVILKQCTLMVDTTAYFATVQCTLASLIYLTFVYNMMFSSICDSVVLLTTLLTCVILSNI